jgi:hypothetical protein
LAAFGREVGLSESHLSKLLNDLIDPTPAVLSKLDRHFGPGKSADMLERMAFSDYCIEIAGAQ